MNIGQLQYNLQRALNVTFSLHLAVKNKIQSTSMHKAFHIANFPHLNYWIILAYCKSPTATDVLLLNFEF